MKVFKITLVLLSVIYSQKAISQVGENDIVEEVYDELTEEWLIYSDELKHYDRLGEFCSNKDYREDIFLVLRKLHHYDSIVLDIINDPVYTLEIDPREYRLTLNDIYKLETEYSVKAFTGFLRESCKKYNDLEDQKEEIANSTGMYSYDGQIFMLETDIGKYLKHLDKKFASLRDHLHKIHPDQLQKIIDLAYNEK